MKNAKSVEIRISVFLKANTSVQMIPKQDRGTKHRILYATFVQWYIRIIKVLLCIKL